jgi:hypothetical protein
MLLSPVVLAVPVLMPVLYNLSVALAVPPSD